MVELSERQLEVMRLIAEGRSGKQVARKLGISPKTVEHHVHTIARKLPHPLGAGPRLRIMAYYYRHIHAPNR